MNNYLRIILIIKKNISVTSLGVSNIQMDS